MNQHSVVPGLQDGLVGLVPSKGFALGLGLTNECNLSCSFCYRDPARVDRLSLEQVRSTMASLPVRSVNLGTGENGMHPEFREILAFLRTLPVKLTITSNGHSVAVLTDEELHAFHDIEFSLDYSSEAKQDAQRGAGNWALIHKQAERCVQLGVPVTFIAVMMKANYLGLANVARIAKRYGAPLRVNVYQAVRSDLYALTYEEYWQGFRALFAETDVIAIDGRPAPRNGRLRSQHCSCHASRHHAAVRLLAWHRRAAFAAGLAWFGNPGDFTLCGGAHRARGMPYVRVSRVVPRRMCGSPPPAKRPARAGLLLPDRAEENRKAGCTHGSCARAAQGGERVYHHRNRPRLAVRFASGERQSAAKHKK